MNETVKNILERRCIRKYKPEQITERELDTLLKCGLQAATAMYAQPWHFTVIQNKELLDEIVESNKQAMRASGDPVAVERANSESFHNFFHAPTVIILSCDPAAKWGAVDCANAVQNMAVAARSMGLGTCYIASFAASIGTPYCTYLDKLDLPEGYVPKLALSVGYPDEEPPIKDRKYLVNIIR